MSQEWLEEDFPNLRASGYEIQSREAYVPNCTGWALRDHHHYWDPHLVGFLPFYYWPPGVPRNDSVDALVQVFQLFQYQECEGMELEAGFEKVAIYGTAEGDATHAARQLPSGSWTSKLGQEEDIEHRTLDALTGEKYGTVVRIMKRPLK